MPDLMALYAEVKDRTMLDERRLAVLERCARQAGPGAVAEIGVYNGGTTRFLARLLPDRTVYAFDTFATIPEVWLPHEDYFEAGQFPTRPDTLAWLRELPNVVICQGKFPKTVTPKILDETFSLVHLDADLEITTIAAIDLIWPRLNGILVLDDYRRPNCPGIERALRSALPDFERFVVEHHDTLTQLVLRKGN